MLFLQVLPPVGLEVGVLVGFGDDRSGPSSGVRFHTEKILAHFEAEGSLVTPVGAPGVLEQPVGNSAAVEGLTNAPTITVDDVVNGSFTLAAGEDGRLLSDIVGETPIPDRTGVDADGDGAVVVDFSLHLFNAKSLTVFRDLEVLVVSDDGAVAPTACGGSAVLTGVIGGALLTSSDSGVLKAGGIGNAVFADEFVSIEGGRTVTAVGDAVDDVLRRQTDGGPRPPAINSDAGLKRRQAPHTPA